MAAIYDTTTGNEITAGLQGCKVCDEALMAAKRIADSRGHDVLLVDDDGEWIVHPVIDGHREPADPVEESADQRTAAAKADDAAKTWTVEHAGHQAGRFFEPLTFDKNRCQNCGMPFFYHTNGTCPRVVEG